MDNGLAELKRRSCEYLKKRYPSVPAHLLPVIKYSDKKANGLTKCISDWITFNGGYCTRINTQGQYNQKLKRFTKSTTKLGTADLHAVINGLHLSVEVKIGADKLSPYQIRTAEEIKAAGGLYYVAKDFQGFYEYYNTQLKKG